jgi:ATP-binding cassette subfamily C protein CydC
MARGLGILPLARHWPALAIGLGLLLLTLVAGLALLFFSGWFITASAMAGLGLIAMINIFTPGAAIRAAALTRTVARYGERLATHAATLQLLTTLRMDVFSKLLRQPSLFLEQLQRGDALNRLTADIDTLDHVYLGVFQPAIGALLLTLATMALVAVASPMIALIVLLPLLLINLSTVLICRRIGQRPSREQALAYPALRQDVMDGLEARLELRALGQVDAFADQVDERSQRLLMRGRALARLDAVGGALILLVSLVAIVASLWLGLGQVPDADVSGPLLAGLILGLFAVSEAWLSLPSAWRRLNQSQVAADRVHQLCPAPGAPPSTAPEPDWPSRADLSIRGLDFRWNAHQPPLFEGFDLELAAGERLAVVGQSGCGKTSLLRLILGQVQPQGGELQLGGVDSRRFSEPTLQRRIAYLPQNPILFRDTVAGNLCLARAQASGEELTAAIESAGLGDWLQGLPQGLNTWLDEAAGNLSGGERRRLALARLFLTDPAFVLLDEPAASLDDRRVDKLNHALDRWLQGRTTVIVTHREEALLPVDRVLRLGTL